MQRPPRSLAALCLSASILVLASCTGGGAGDTTRTPDEGARPTGAVQALEASQPRDWRASPDTWAVTLSWQAPTGAAVDHYEIRRDDVPLASEVRTTSYRDEDVDPATVYTYSVIGVGAAGVPTEPAITKVKTHAPAVGDARLQGSFLVKMEVAGSSGLTQEPGGGSLIFVYDPRCETGACPVRWQVRSHDPKATLARNRGHYQGQTHGSLLLRGCTGGKINEAIDVRTRVLAAGPVRGAWRATRIVGSLHESGKTRGCSAASITWTFKGVIQT